MLTPLTMRGEVLVDRLCRFAAGAHGEDDGGAAGDDVAAGKDAALGGAQAFGIGHDVVPLIGGEVGSGALDEGIGGGADADDGDVGGQDVFGAGDRHGTAAAARVGLAQLHAHAARAGEPAFFVAQKLDGIGQHAELDALFARVLHFFGACGHLGFRPPIDQRGRLRAQAAGGAYRVHRGVAAAHHDHVAVAAIVNRLVEFGKLVGAHQVGAGEKLVGGVDAVQVLAGHMPRNTGNPAPVATKTASNPSLRISSSMVTLLPTTTLVSNSTPMRRRLSTSVLDDGFGQAKLGNAVDEHAAQFVQRLKDTDAMAFLHQIARGGKPGRTAADDGHALAGGGSDGGQAQVRFRARKSAMKRSRLPMATGSPFLPITQPPSH
jgi:hypothetical protein